MPFGALKLAGKPDLHTRPLVEKNLMPFGALKRKAGALGVGPAGGGEGGVGGKEPNALRGIEMCLCRRGTMRRGGGSVEKNLMPFGALKWSSECSCTRGTPTASGGKEPNALRGIEISM